MKVNKDLKPEIAESVTALAYAGLIMGNDVDELKIILGMIIAKCAAAAELLLPHLRLLLHPQSSCSAACRSPRARYGKPYIEEIYQNKEMYIAARFLKVLDGTQVPLPAPRAPILRHVPQRWAARCAAMQQCCVPTESPPAAPAPAPADARPVGGRRLLDRDRQGVRRRVHPEALWQHRPAPLRLARHCAADAR
jgi:hypothetical protein